MISGEKRTCDNVAEASRGLAILNYALANRTKRLKVYAISVNLVNTSHCGGIARNKRGSRDESKE